MSQYIVIEGRKVDVYRYETIIVGTGAAAYNAADHIWKRGRQSIAMVTEGVNMGTSRNTGADKQTYYKLTSSGAAPDSVRSMGQTLFDGGCMDGDIALAEAAGSARCFFRLADIGVDFPQNRAGEYVGYKTDHDPFSRASSVGPLTAQIITQCLQGEVQRDGIDIHDRCQVIEILVFEKNEKRQVAGVLALRLDHMDEPDRRYCIFSAGNVVYATGGEAGMYQACVYPPSQTGATGVALRAGVRGKNLTESQFGIASIKFRWNLSGTYQQVLPRYISTDEKGGDEREFLDEYFSSPNALLNAIFLKGYQWPFDPRKIENDGSSLIDVLVYHETVIRKRRVFMDYSRNPSCALTQEGGFDSSQAAGVALEYLTTSGALQARPIDRLAHMNPYAITLYKDHHIDLYTQPLEIAVCAQHNNGGLAGDIWWQCPDIRRFFPVGEVNGSHGVYRPGGSALNSGQVGSLRASEYITGTPPVEALTATEIQTHCGPSLCSIVAWTEKALTATSCGHTIAQEIQDIKTRMTGYGAHIRSAEGTGNALKEAREQLDRVLHSACAKAGELGALHKLLDFAVCQYAYLFAITDYIQHGGASRGSYLVYDPDGIKPKASLPDIFRYRLDGNAHSNVIQEIMYADGECRAQWRDVRPLPAEEEWFENVWRDYREGKIYS